MADDDRLSLDYAEFVSQLEQQQATAPVPRWALPWAPLSGGPVVPLATGAQYVALMLPRASVNSHGIFFVQAMASICHKMRLQRKDISPVIDVGGDSSSDSDGDGAPPPTAVELWAWPKATGLDSWCPGVPTILIARAWLDTIHEPHTLQAYLTPGVDASLFLNAAANRLPVPMVPWSPDTDESDSASDAGAKPWISQCIANPDMTYAAAIKKVAVVLTTSKAGVVTHRGDALELWAVTGLADRGATGDPLAHPTAFRPSSLVPPTTLLVLRQPELTPGPRRGRSLSAPPSLPWATGHPQDDPLVVGAARLVYATKDSEPFCATITSVQVRGDWRRRGVGASLIAASEARVLSHAIGGLPWEAVTLRIAPVAPPGTPPTRSPDPDAFLLAQGYMPEPPIGDVTCHESSSRQVPRATPCSCGKCRPGEDGSRGGGHAAPRAPPTPPTPVLALTPWQRWLIGSESVLALHAGRAGLTALLRLMRSDRGKYGPPAAALLAPGAPPPPRVCLADLPAPFRRHCAGVTALPPDARDGELTGAYIAGYAAILVSAGECVLLGQQPSRRAVLSRALGPPRGVARRTKRSRNGVAAAAAADDAAAAAAAAPFAPPPSHRIASAHYYLSRGGTVHAAVSALAHAALHRATLHHSFDRTYFSSDGRAVWPNDPDTPWTTEPSLGVVGNGACPTLCDGDLNLAAMMTSLLGRGGGLKLSGCVGCKRPLPIPPVLPIPPTAVDVPVPVVADAAGHGGDADAATTAGAGAGSDLDDNDLGPGGGVYDITAARAAAEAPGDDEAISGDRLATDAAAVGASRRRYEELMFGQSTFAVPTPCPADCEGVTLGSGIEKEDKADGNAGKAGKTVVVVKPGPGAPPPAEDADHQVVVVATGKRQGRSGSKRKA